MEERIDGKWYRNAGSDDEFRALVCAYLNGDGGNLSIAGKSDVPNLLKAIIPNALVFYRKHKDGFYCVDVPRGNDKPYSLGGRFYVMHGGQAVPAAIDEIKDMLLASQVAPLRWERWFSDGIGIENFDEDELHFLFEDNARPSQEEIVEKLEHLGLSRQGRFTNATDVLLCKDVATRHPQIRAKAVAYNHKADEVYQGHETFEGPLLKVFNALYQFVLRHIAIGSRFSDKTPVREEIYQYPPQAIREGLINALVHRDYESYAGSVKVEIQGTRLIISNTGGLYGGMTIERLRAGHLSAFRNPDMANYLNRRGYMEMTGRGSVLIQEACRKNGLPEPQWEADENSVSLTFTAKNGGGGHGEKLPPKVIGKGKSTDTSKGKRNTKSKGKSKGKGKGKNNKGIGINSKERILAILSSNPVATIEDLCGATGLSISGVEKNIRELKHANRLNRHGPSRGGHWEVVPKQTGQE